MVYPGFFFSFITFPVAQKFTYTLGQTWVKQTPHNMLLEHKFSFRLRSGYVLTFGSVFGVRPIWKTHLQPSFNSLTDVLSCCFMNPHNRGVAQHSGPSTRRHSQWAPPGSTAFHLLCFVFPPYQRALYTQCPFFCQSNINVLNTPSP